MHCSASVTAGKIEDVIVLNELARQLGRQQLLAEAEQQVELAHTLICGIGMLDARGYHYLCIK